MPDSVPNKIREERNTQLRILSEKKRRAFYSKYIGQTANVLMEEAEKGGVMHGFTDNYIKVSMPYDPALVNTIVPVVLGDFDEMGFLEGRSEELRINS
jgi:threonylcarbamoyladenosine tRNA methylthiotransferase MtaB